MTDELTTRAFVNAGSWVALCPQPWCLGFDHYGPGPNTGRIGGLGESTFTCPRCTTVSRVAWPDNGEDIMHVLAQRPMFETRNWQPGETLEDLLVENAVHGLIPAQLLAGVDLVIRGERFEDRTVLAGRTLHAIGG